MRISFIAFLLAFWVHEAWAQTVTVQDVRTAVALNDIAKLDADLSRAERLVQKGEMPADALRALFLALSRSAPDMVRFVETWVKEAPGNPRAQTARAMSLRQAAAFVGRGDGFAATNVALQMRAKAASLARTAYATDPFLIPASDLILEGLGIGETFPAWTAVVNKVLGHTPNWGTVRRGLYAMGTPSVDSIRAYCGAASSQFDDAIRPDISNLCLVSAVALSGATDLVDEYPDISLTPKDPARALDGLKVLVQHIEPNDWTTAQLQWSVDLFLTVPVNQSQLIALAKLAEPFGQKATGEANQFKRAFGAARRDMALAYLKQDPLNIDLIDLIESAPQDETFAVRVAPDGTLNIRKNTQTEIQPARAAQAASTETFALRRIEASPFKSAYWTAFAEIADQRDPPVSLLDGDAARRNAVLYAKDPVAALNALLNTKAGHFKLLEQYVTMPKQELAKLPEWERFLLQTNVPGQILCPYLQAHLLRDGLCDDAQESTPACSASGRPMDANQTRLLQMAKGSPICSPLLGKSIEELWFEPSGYAEATAVPLRD